MLSVCQNSVEVNKIVLVIFNILYLNISSIYIEIYHLFASFLKMNANLFLSFIFRQTYFSGPQGSWSVHVCCLHLKMEFRSCVRGHQWCGIIHYYWWTASINSRLLFSRAGFASWGFPFHQFKQNLEEINKGIYISACFNNFLVITYKILQCLTLRLQSATYLKNPFYVAREIFHYILIL